MADFGGLGLWLWKSDSSGWVQISSMNVNRVKPVRFVGGSQDYELLAQNNAEDQGLYWGNWNGSSFVWTQITCPTVNWYSLLCKTFDI